jgi:hypothetical protein
MQTEFRWPSDRTAADLGESGFLSSLLGGVLMMRTFVGTTLMALIIGVVSVGPAAANTLLSDFSNFNLSGTYEQWNNATFTSGATSFRVESPGDFGGGYYNLPATVNASGETALQLLMDVNSGNVASLMNVVLIDGDGTERVFRFDNLVAGAGQTLTKPLSMFLQDNAPGSTPGLDLANITVFHLQGTFSNGNPGQAMDLTFDNLALVPEPATLLMSCLVWAGLAGLVRRRR